MCLCSMSPSILESHPWRRKPHSGRPERQATSTDPFLCFSAVLSLPFSWAICAPRGSADPLARVAAGDRRVPRWVGRWMEVQSPHSGGGAQQEGKKAPASASNGSHPQPKFPCGDGWRQPRASGPESLPHAPLFLPFSYKRSLRISQPWDPRLPTPQAPVPAAQLL